MREVTRKVVAQRNAKTTTTIVASRPAGRCFGASGDSGATPERALEASGLKSVATAALSRG